MRRPPAPSSVPALFEALLRCNSAIVRARSRDAMIADVSRILNRTPGITAAWIGLLDRDAGTLHAAGLPASLRRHKRQLELSPEAPGPHRNPVAVAMSRGQPRYCADFQNDKSTRPWHALALRLGVRCSAALPLHVHGTVAGVFSLYSDRPGFFTAPVRRVLFNLAEDITFALEYFDSEQRRLQASQALENSEAHFRELFESNPQPMWLLGEDSHRFLAVNDAAIAKYGYSREEFLAMRAEDIRPADEVERLRSEMATRVEGTRQAGQWRHVRKNGETIIAEVATHRMNWHSEAARLVIATDVTPIHAAQRALAESEAKFRSLVEQNLTGIYIGNETHLLYANPYLAEIMGYRPEEMINKPFAELLEPAMWDKLRRRSASRFAEGPRTLQYDFAARRKDGRLVHIGAHDTLTVYQGKIAAIGVAQDISERKQAQEQIRTYIRQLETSMHSTVKAVSTMVEMRDPYTSGHERRVGELAAQIAAELGLPSERCQGIRLIGEVHDIGKIGVPAEILSKPARLTHNEFEIIKTHSEHGYEILKGVEFPWPVADAIRQHHERLDGSGYPLGLKGEEIILEARILAVADVVESMSSHRPYRPALGVDAALNEVIKGRGVRYDPQVVDACARLLRERNYVIPD